MEALYAKLYSKYTKLKKEKDSELEKLNLDQEVKFMNYVAAAEEMIEYLRSENDRLVEQVSGLHNEITSIRSSKDEQQIQYQKLLMEENQKTKDLSEEIERLRNLQNEGLCCSGNEGKQLSTPGALEVDGSTSSTVNTTRKRGRKSLRGIENNIAVREVPHALGRESEEGLFQQIEPASDRRNIENSGGDATDSGPLSYMFKDLAECIVGMKFSALKRKEELSVLGLHQSSGYTFSLTWINNSSGQPELLYRVQSLGTFQRVAPEWMREEIIFSTTMCPIFFERLSRVIKFN